MGLALTPGAREEALNAFQRDPVYLVDMLEHEALIAYKAKVWQARADLQVAVTNAKNRCTLKECHIQTPCGTGKCPYTTGADMASITTTKIGQIQRPVAGTLPFSLDEAYGELKEIRGIRQPASFSSGQTRRSA